MASADSDHFQTELGLNIYVTVSDVRDGIARTRTMVSEVQHDVADTCAMVADIVVVTY